MTWGSPTISSLGDVCFLNTPVGILSWFLEANLEKLTLAITPAALETSQELGGGTMPKPSSCIWGSVQTSISAA